MRRGLTVLAAGALICAPAATPAATEAREPIQSGDAIAARLIEVGAWEFSATRRGPDGQPECTESWTFNADGSGLIVSGKQRVTTIWMVSQPTDVGQFVFINNQTTTEGPDCMGHAIDKSLYPLGQSGFQLLFYGDGRSALVCSEGKQVVRPDGSSFTALEPEDCWGRIVPAAK